LSLTEKKLKVYELLGKLCFRAFYAFIFIIAFIVILIFLLIFCCQSKGAEITVPLGAVEAILGGTLYPTVKWLFPIEK
jgi:hypothetical protein